MHAIWERTTRKKIMPARGPRSDLCVVVVTTSQYSNGCASSCAATRPLRAHSAPCEHPKVAPRVRPGSGTSSGKQGPLSALQVCTLRCSPGLAVPARYFVQC